MPVIPLDCPSCGTELRIDSVESVAICSHCGKPFVVNDAIVQNYIKLVTAGNERDLALNEYEMEGTVLIRYNGDSSAVYIPDNVTVIGKRAFEDCDELTELSFPNSLSKIGTYAFSGCNKLKELVLPASLIDELPWTAVQYDDKLTNVTFIYNSGKKEKVPRKNYWRRY